VGGNPGNAGNPMALDMRSSGTNTAGNGAPAGNNSAPAKVRQLAASTGFVCSR